MTKQHYINDGHTATTDSDQSHAPLIVVTEALPSEESAEDETSKVCIKYLFFCFFNQFFKPKNKTKMLFSKSGNQKKKILGDEKYLIPLTVARYCL